MPLADLEPLVISTEVQELPAGRARGLHLAAADAEHGKVTYLQEILEGGFFVYVGQSDNLQEHWLGPGCWAAFCDHEGTGHASRVGPNGCKRRFRLLRGLLIP